MKMEARSEGEDDEVMLLSDDERDVIEFGVDDDDKSDTVNATELKDFMSKLRFGGQDLAGRSRKDAGSTSVTKSKKAAGKSLSSRKQLTEKIQHCDVSSTTKGETMHQPMAQQKMALKRADRPVKSADASSLGKKDKHASLESKNTLNASQHGKKDKPQTSVKTISGSDNKVVSRGKGDDQKRLYSYKTRTNLLIKPGTNILDNQISLEDVGKPPPRLVRDLEDLAFKITANETEVYSQQKDRRGKSEGGWMKTVVTSGTLGDKTAALTLQVQASPVHHIQSLATLVTMATKKGRRENSQAVESLQDLFLINILPDVRHLIAFEQRPLEKLAEMTSGHKDAFDRTLLCWYIESQLKAKYLAFIKAIEVLTFDTVTASKKSAIDTIYKMLSTKPEQEQLLLSILVNKMGDREHKVASKSAYLLTRLVDYKNHPNMKTSVVKEVENLLYRPNISPRAQYYAICFLSQVLLSQTETDLANKLITIHLSFFKVYIQKGEVDRKMMGSLLSGVNRAYPYAKVEKGRMSGLINDLYRLVHTINFNTSVQALLLLYQVNNAQDNTSDRFYTALYKKLTDPGLKRSSKQNLMLNLLYKTITTDSCQERVKAFIKRLLQVCNHQLPPFICGALFLVSEVLQRNTKLSLNTDTRYTHQQRTPDPQRYCGDTDDDDDGLEHFTDARNPDSDTDDMGQGDDVHEPSATSSWHHQFIRPENDRTTRSELYDPLHRNPRYCHGDRDCVWELEHLSNHYHPSVALFAASILKGEAVSYDGDPLRDFTLIRFLDRFAFKNPKSTTSQAGSAATMRRRDYKPRGLRALPLSSTAYLQTAPVHVPAEEKFLYNYLKRQGVTPPTEYDSDDESIDDDEFDRYLDTIGMTEKKMKKAPDFATEMGSGRKRKKGRDDSGDESAEDEEIEFDEDERREMMGDDSDGGDAGGDGGAGFMVDEFDEEQIAFSDDDSPRQRKTKPSRKRKLLEGTGKAAGGKKTKSDMSDLFAAADEFASLLDDNLSMKTDSIGTTALSNTDKASTKQLAWEAKQQKWLQDSDWKERGGKGNFIHRGNPKQKGKAKQKETVNQKGKHKGIAHMGNVKPKK